MIRTLHTSVIICTHQLQGLESLCDDIGILKDGRLVAAGEVRQLVHQRWPQRRYLLAVDGDLASAQQIVTSLVGDRWRSRRRGSAPVPSPALLLGLVAEYTCRRVLLGCTPGVAPVRPEAEHRGRHASPGDRRRPAGERGDLARGRRAGSALGALRRTVGEPEPSPASCAADLAPPRELVAVLVVPGPGGRGAGRARGDPGVGGRRFAKLRTGWATSRTASASPTRPPACSSCSTAADPRELSRSPGEVHRSGRLPVVVRRLRAWFGV